MSTKDKDVEVITFKVDKDIVKRLKGVKNRSDFIRMAIFNALENACPVCKGSGILSGERKKHWDEFTARHHTQECKKCNGLVVTCKKH